MPTPKGSKKLLSQKASSGISKKSKKNRALSKAGY